ncbi:MAG TPA: hypothetical protein VFM02_03460 [Candidatus Paceibacterota bacterium]|nr:hypothetical protein [Candidatus Paceibacterota bacterium]
MNEIARNDQARAALTDFIGENCQPFRPYAVYRRNTRRIEAVFRDCSTEEIFLGRSGVISILKDSHSEKVAGVTMRCDLELLLREEEGGSLSLRNALKRFLKKLMVYDPDAFKEIIKRYRALRRLVNKDLMIKILD